MGNALEMFISGVPALREPVCHGHVNVAPMEGALLLRRGPIWPPCPISLTRAPTWGRRDCSSLGGGQHQHPHEGATPNWVLTGALV